MPSIFNDAYLGRTIVLTLYVWLNFLLFIGNTRYIFNGKPKDAIDRVMYAFAVFMFVSAMLIGADMFIRLVLTVYGGR